MTFVGRIERGFDLLGYHFGPEGFTVAAKTIEQFVARAIRLYEHEPGGLAPQPGLEAEHFAAHSTRPEAYFDSAGLLWSLNGAHRVALDAHTTTMRIKQGRTPTYWVTAAIPSEARRSREIGTSSFGGAGGAMRGAGGAMATSDPLTASKANAKPKS